ASALIRLEKYDRAEEVLKNIGNAEPKNLEHRSRLASFYDDRRDYDKAEKILREVIRLDPDNEQHYLVLARFQVMRRGVTEGEAVLLEGQRALPRSSAIRFALGALYELDRRPEKAQKVYEGVLDEYRGKPAALEAKVKLAALDWSAGKRDDAEKQV